MHPNPAYRQEPRAANIAFARDQGFGMLAVESEDAAPLISHIPFLLTEDGALAEFHLVRSNPIVRALKAPRQARLAVQGPHSYISPDWYGLADQVPTWNYVAVHLVGRLDLAAQDGLRDLLDRQSAAYENQLLPKPPWRSDKMTPDLLARMMRQIIPCRMRIDDIQGTWKLGQNKPGGARAASAAKAGDAGIGSETRRLSELMLGAAENQ